MAFRSCQAAAPLRRPSKRRPWRPLALPQLPDAPDRLRPEPDRKQPPHGGGRSPAAGSPACRHANMGAAFLRSREMPAMWTTNSPPTMPLLRLWRYAQSHRGNHRRRRSLDAPRLHFFQRLCNVCKRILFVLFSSIVIVFCYGIIGFDHFEILRKQFFYMDLAQRFLL